MTDYNFWADLLNKYSQLTPWVQAVTTIAFCMWMLGWGYFLKEIIRVIKN